MRELNDLPAVDNGVMYGRVRPFKLPAADFDLKTLDRFNQRVPQYLRKHAWRPRMQIQKSLAGLGLGIHLRSVPIGEKGQFLLQQIICEPPRRGKNFRGRCPLAM